MSDSKAEMLKLMTRRLASKDVSEKQIATLADTVINSKHKFVGVDPCIIGTCFELEWHGKLRDFNLAELIEELPGRFHEIDIRERGIFPNDRHFNVSITQDM